MPDYIPTLKSTLLELRLLADNDQAGLYKYSKGAVGVGGRKPRSEQFITDEDRMLLHDKVRIREQWVECKFA